MNAFRANSTVPSETDCRQHAVAEAGVGEAISRLRNLAGWWEGDANAREVLEQLVDATRQETIRMLSAPR